MEKICIWNNYAFFGCCFDLTNKKKLFWESTLKFHSNTEYAQENSISPRLWPHKSTAKNEKKNAHMGLMILTHFFDIQLQHQQQIFSPIFFRNWLWILNKFVQVGHMFFFFFYLHYILFKFMLFVYSLIDMFLFFNYID